MIYRENIPQGKSNRYCTYDNAMKFNIHLNALRILLGLMLDKEMFREDFIFFSLSAKASY